MILQIFKIAWKQRKFNSILIIEIVFSFIALFVLSAVALHYYKLYKEPLGMEYQHLWNITVQVKKEKDKKSNLFDGMNDSIRAIKADLIKVHLRNNPYIASSAKSTGSDFIYAQGRWTSCYLYNNQQYCFDEFISDEDFATTTRLNLVEGRWFNSEDRFSKIQSVIINSKFKNELFGDSIAEGKSIVVKEGDNVKTIKIVGVFDHLKRMGEFEAEPNFVVFCGAGSDFFIFGQEGFIIRTKSQVPPNFEASLIKDLQNYDKSFNYRLLQVDGMRNMYLKKKLMPL